MFKDLFMRDGKWSSKKVWFNIACAVASYCLIYITKKGNMEAWAYICLYSVYLACLGGFEIIPKVLAMVLEFKNGGKINATISPTTTSEG